MWRALALISLLAASAGAASDRGSMNLGTVLFAPSDAHKDCWTSEQLALLTSRHVIEGILPGRNCLDVNDSSMISDIVEYFRLVLEVVRKNTSGKVKHLMLLAVTDALGGYMKHFFLPLSKYSYYAGNVDYNSVIKVHQLYDELKTYLRTNGAGWTRPPNDIGRRVCAQPINIKDRKIGSGQDPCAGLIFQEGDTPSAIGTPTIEIPMPYFDSKSHPSAIAIPFRAYSLRNVEARSSAYVLVKYYIAASKCLACRDSNDTTPSSVADFNAKLFGFVTQKVLPRLCDEKFYAAFGGVLRIIETMKQAGYVKNLNVLGNFNIMPEFEEKEENLMGMASDKPSDEEDEDLVVNANKNGAGGAGGNAGSGGKVGSPSSSDDGGNNSNNNENGSASGGGSNNNNNNNNNNGNNANGMQRSESFASDTSSSAQNEMKSKKNRSNLILLAALATIIIWFFLGACFVCCRIRSARIKKDEQMKLIEGGGTQSSSTRSKCLSNSGSTKTKCSTATGKAASCTKQSCEQFHGSSTTTGQAGSPAATTSSSKSSSKRTTPKSGVSSNNGTSESPSKTSESDNSPRSPKRPTQVQTMHYYPASFACHSSIAGKYKVGSSSEEFSSKSTIKKPFVFGYDFQTTSEESTPRDQSDGENETEMGNLSK